MALRRICVFAGSSAGVREAYTTAAAALGRALARRDIGVVYGGASRGLMGVLADAALTEGGEVIGVLPRGLFAREVAHAGLTTLHEVGSMHERKALMSDLSDAFVMLPGGFGTCEEFMESVTWTQLGIHDKRCGILNVDGFFDALLAFIGHAADQGFIKARQVEGLVIAEDADELLDSIVGPARDQVAAT